MADKTPEELAAEAKVASERADAAAKEAPAKAKFHEWLDEWANKREQAGRPKDKTDTGPRPASFFDTLFGSAPGPKP